MGFDLTPIGTPTYTNNGGAFAYSFSGGSGTCANPFPTGGTFTLTGRFKIASAPGSIQVLLGANNCIYIAMNSSGKLIANTGASTQITSASSYADGAYHHFEFVATAGVVSRFFVDGVEVGTSTTMLGASATYTDVLQFRGFIANSAFDWTGELEEVNIWSTALHTTGFTPPTTPTSDSATGLVAAWHFENNLFDTKTGGGGGGGALTIGAASLSSATDTAVNVAVVAASGGTAPITYQWYRSTVSNFTVGAGTLLASATSATLADTTAAADTPYFYICRATDAAAATATSNQTQGVKKAATFKLGLIGDSNTAGFGLTGGQDIGSQLAIILAKTYKQRAVSVTNNGVSGSNSGTWLSGSANLNGAISAFNAAGVTHVHYAIGTNDMAPAVATSAASYRSNIANTAAALVAAGMKLILSYPVFTQIGGGTIDAAAIALGQQYFAQIDSLIDGTNILQGDKLAYNYFMDNLAQFQGDKIHIDANGAIAWATMIARPIDRYVLDPVGASPTLTTRTVTITLNTDASTPAASLTGLKVSFWDESSPELTTTARYQAAAETTDGSGVLTFAFSSTLTVGGTGWIDVRGTGLHYCGQVVVS